MSRLPSDRLVRPDGPAHAAAVFAHCLPATDDHDPALHVAEALARRGIVVLSVDTTDLDPDGLVEWAELVADELQAPALLVGHAIGGTLALAAAARLASVRAVATIAAPAEADVVGGSLDDIAAEIDAATLFLHAPLDDQVDVDNARVLFLAAKHPKSYLSLDDADHALSDPRDAAWAADVIASWACRYLPEPDRGSYTDSGAVAVTGERLAANVLTRGFTLRVGEPAASGGDESGPTPYDLLAGALAACTSLTLRMYADREGLSLRRARVGVQFDRVHARDLEHVEDDEGHIELFTRTVELEGDLDQETRQLLLEIADRCPVHRTLEGNLHIVAEPPT